MNRDTGIENFTEIFNKLSPTDKAKTVLLIELTAKLLSGIGQANNNKN